MDLLDLPVPSSLTKEVVESVHHWTDSLFSFRISRPASFRFRSGEFVMLGLFVNAKPLLRAYSIASPSWDDGLDFYSIKVADGPLTSRLQEIRPGDHILLGKKPTGTLVHDALLPGRRLYLLSTGTGIAPFASVMRDPDTYERFDEIILTHTCREKGDLAYGQKMVQDLIDDPLVGEMAAGKIRLYNSTTREKYDYMGRITTLIESGKLFDDLGVDPFNPDEDRVMICGAMDMIRDTKELVLKAGLSEGSNAAPGQFVVEKAFAG